MERIPGFTPRPRASAFYMNPWAYFKWGEGPLRHVLVGEATQQLRPCRPASLMKAKDVHSACMHLTHGTVLANFLDKLVYFPLSQSLRLSVSPSASPLPDSYNV